MTSSAQPCIPAPPCGADDASITLRTSPGLIRTISWATKLPIEKPRMSTWSNPIAVTKAMASWAICSIVFGVLPVEPPTPVLSNVTTCRFVASASISAGSQLSRFPRKCWSSTSGTAPSPTERYVQSTPFAALTCLPGISEYVVAIVVLSVVVTVAVRDFTGH